MTLKLFYDTETTGLPNFKAPSIDPAQPHIVQLAASLVDVETRVTVAAIDLIVRPNGWTIPQDVADVHGITTEIALRRGVDEGVAITAFFQLWLQAQERVAHNQSFDERILRIGLLRFLGESNAQQWAEGASECTMLLATPIMNLPATEKMARAGFNKPKAPKLAEAVEFFTGRPLVDAHQARADVIGCAAVYWAIQDGVRERVQPVAVAA